MTFREIAHGSSDYEQELRLRDGVLRRPLGLSLSSDDLADDERHLHFGLFEPETGLIACVVAVPVSPTEARIRQMAVSPTHQGRGLGRRLLGELERNLQGRGFRRFVLNARTSAVGFYEKLGYTIVGDEFTDVTVPHVRMEKAASGR